MAGDKRIGEKENEKVEKYQELKRQIARMWNMRTVGVIPIVIRSLGKVTKNLDTWLEKLYSLYVFSLAKSLQLILKISATYRLVRMRVQCMISNNHMSKKAKGRKAGWHFRDKYDDGDDDDDDDHEVELYNSYK